MLNVLLGFFLVILTSYTSVFALFFLVKYLSGWKELEQIYPASRTDETGPKRYFVSLRLNWLSYNNSAKLEALNGGLRIQQTFFGFFGTHKPAFIPWTEIFYVEKTENPGVFVRNEYLFRLSRLNRLSLRIPSRVGSWILEQKNFYTLPRS
ncbi:MAG: hypothetical protein HYY51_03805 [Candidatus Magasanikbacteria bacterium]|nr:hypothetical protein [Candidatus Magasanikbacteria bacterium]